MPAIVFDNAQTAFRVNGHIPPPAQVIPIIGRGIRQSLEA